MTFDDLAVGYLTFRRPSGEIDRKPRIVTADEIPDPQTLDLSLTVNGLQKQSSNTAFMLFTVSELVADISQGITLEPGDIIATVEKIGTLRHPIMQA